MDSEQPHGPIFDRITDRLTPVSQSGRERILELPRGDTAHDAAMADLPAFREVETGHLHNAGAHPGPSLRIAAWNMERGLFPDASAALLRMQAPDLVLLTEMDAGVARTRQRHTIAEVAERLEHAYAYGLEFLELAVMPPPPGQPDGDRHNDLGFHGNGFTTSLPFERPVVIRLPREADWYSAPRGGQKRIGSRMAVAATLHCGGAAFVACSVHLESDSDFAGRARQMTALLDALDRYAGGLPVVIGGDLNTNVAWLDDPREMLFCRAEDRGYDWRNSNAPGITTRASLWSNGARTDRRLDWICTRGMASHSPAIIAALDAEGRPLSDHDLVMVTVTPSRT